jgi:hypothetical protein
VTSELLRHLTDNDSLLFLSSECFLLVKDLEMSNSGLDILERVQHLLPRQQVPAI